MINQRRTRKKLSKAEMAKLKKVVLARQVENERIRSKELEIKSAIFRKVPGKLLWAFCLLTSVFSAVFLVDGMLEKKYTKFEIISSTEDRVDVVSGGWLVPATFNWAFLDKSKKLGIHMYKGEFNKVNKNGYIEVGRSPLFKVPYDFKIETPNKKPIIKELQVNFGYLYVLPIFLFIVCSVWLFVKPHLDYQLIVFGYFNMFIATTAMFFLMLQVTQYLSDIGMYEIDFRGLVIPYK